MPEGEENSKGWGNSEFIGPTVLFYGYGSQSCHKLQTQGTLKMLISGP